MGVSVEKKLKELDTASELYFYYDDDVSIREQIIVVLRDKRVVFFDGEISSKDVLRKIKTGTIDVVVTFLGRTNEWIAFCESHGVDCKLTPKEKQEDFVIIPAQKPREGQNEAE